MPCAARTCCASYVFTRRSRMATPGPQRDQSRRGPTSRSACPASGRNPIDLQMHERLRVQGAAETTTASASWVQGTGTEPRSGDRLPRQNGHARQSGQESDARNLWERLKNYETAVLRFAKHPDVAFTNNRAERDLRMAKVKQKVSGCFRTRKSCRILWPNLLAIRREFWYWTITRVTNPSGFLTFEKSLSTGKPLIMWLPSSYDVLTVLLRQEIVKIVARSLFLTRGPAPFIGDDLDGAL